MKYKNKFSALIEDTTDAIHELVSDYIEDNVTITLEDEIQDLVDEDYFDFYHAVHRTVLKQLLKEMDLHGN